MFKIFCKTHLFNPWKSKEYDEIFKKSNLRISRERAFVLMQLMQSVSNIEGAVAELGVYKGSTAYLIAGLIEKLNLNKKMYLFDTFLGTPSSSMMDNIQRKGFYSDVSINNVKLFLKDFESFIIYKQGLIPDIFKEMEEIKFSFVHLHLNLYNSTKTSLEYCFDRMSTGGIILIEDYGLMNCIGVMKATDEFLSKINRHPVYLPTGQCFIIKN